LQGNSQIRAKKILITRKYDPANARGIRPGNIKDKEKKDENVVEKYSVPRRRRANEDKDEENVIIAW